MVKKWLISAFIVLNLLTPVYMALPAGLPGAPAGVCGLIGLVDQIYANAVGLNNAWVLFAEIAHADFRLVIKAEYADGATVVLPLPRQSERTFWQRHLFDFKEMKIDAAQQLDPGARRAYAAYLCRRFPTHDGAPVKAIVWEAEERPLLSVYEAGRHGTHLTPQTRKGVLDRAPYRPDGAPAQGHTAP